MNTFKTACIDLDDMDASYVYFPISCLTLLAFIISWVGKWVKPRHQIIANFIVEESLIEHISIICQVVFAFYYGNALFGILCLLIWLSYVTMQVLYHRAF